MNDIIENYKHIILEKYAAFEGRAGRPEFWYFVLANLIISTVLSIIESIFIGAPRGMRDDSVLSNIYSLIVLVPSIAVGIRRMHDIDRSGWWILFPLYNIWLFAKKGTSGPNRFSGDLIPAEPAPIPVAAPQPTDEPTVSETEQPKQ